MMLQGGGGGGSIPPNISSSGEATGTGGSSSHIHETITAVTAAGDIGSGSGGYSEDERGRIEDSGRNSGGNRWPRQETLALLQIRSDMDVAFRDSSLKGPLWDEVSRKLAELGYHRSAKKCKEKFENVYKYHKRTKEGRTSKADGKTYRFFDQLQALEGSSTAVHQPPLSLPPPPPPPVVSIPPHQMNISAMQNTTQILPAAVTPISVAVSHQNNVDPISVAAPAVAMPNINHVGGFSFSQLNMSGGSSSSSTSSDDEPPESRSNRKRKWKDFFGKLMKEVIDKQEELQSKFLETLERRERDRMAREDSWRMQEMAKMKREHELLLQERSMVAAKDAAVVNFLQKMTQQNPNVVIPQVPAMQLLQQQHQPLATQQTRPPPPPSPSPPPPPPTQAVTAIQPQQQQQPPPPPQPQHQPKQQASLPLAVVPVPVPVPVTASVPATAPPPPPAAVKNLDNGGGGDNMLQPSPSRWPKAEINALISLRTTLDTKYLESGPKGPLWEEISSAMRKLGYNRNAKRCKEKWENINKYYKKVKESSKKRPEDSKTCPYFHQLDAIYRDKASSLNNPGFSLKPETTQMAPIMARPEQQWPLPTTVIHQQQQQHQPLQHHHQQQQQQPQQQQQQTKTHEHASSENHPHDDEYDDEDDDEEDEEDDDEEGGDYEIVPNKTSSMAAVE